MEIQTSEITFLRKTKYYLIEDGEKEIEIEKSWTDIDNEYNVDFGILSVKKNGEKITLTDEELIKLEDFVIDLK